LKKIFSLLLIISFVFLCSCSKTTEENITTTTEFEEFTSQTTAEYVTKSKGLFYTEEIKTDASDPYSYIIKQSCEAILNAWNKTTGYDDNAEDFERFIKKCQNVYYFLYDLNGDGTDELLLGGWVKTDFTLENESPREIFIQDVYAIQNGKAVQVDGFDIIQSEYIADQALLSNGSILIWWSKNVRASYLFVSYNGKKLKIDVSVGYIKDNHYGKESDVGDTTFKSEYIDKKEFERVYKEYYGDNERIEINWKRIDEYGK
jgi:hypothetical protein